MDDFESQLLAVDAHAGFAVAIELLQLNLGLRCNLRCAHCHQSSSPERSETMPDRVFLAALDFARAVKPRLIDLTGGAPELHPRLRTYLAELRRAGFEVQLRTNLTLLVETSFGDLVGLLASQRVGLLASLPSSDPELTARQRGGGSFEKSILALRTLNAAGYGAEGGPRLDLVANPDGQSLFGTAASVEGRLRRDLLERHGVRFNALLTLANVPVGRFGAGLDRSGARARYLQTLRAAFNPAVVPRLACRTSLAVAWDGRLFDCDFNLGAGLPLRDAPRTVFEADASLASRRLSFGPHCFSCTALAGSS